MMSLSSVGCSFNHEGRTLLRALYARICHGIMQHNGFVERSAENARLPSGMLPAQCAINNIGPCNRCEQFKIARFTLSYLKITW